MRNETNMASDTESSKEKELLIIGGGIAGLSAGIYARQQQVLGRGGGYRTTILEMGERPGGQLTAWQRQGYTFDFCLQWLIGSHHGVYHDIYREIGAIDDETEVVNHDVFLRMVDEEHGDFCFYGNMDQWETYLKEMAPEDSKGIHKLCNMIKKSVEVEEFQNPPGMRSVWDYFAQILKGWRSLPMIAHYVKHTNQELLDDLGLKNNKLRHFLGRFPFEPGRDVPGVLLLMVLGWQHEKNAGYLKGGSSAMVKRIMDTYTKLGGEFKFNSKVKEIVVEGDVARGVVLENGQHLVADHVISACDGHTVLYDMLGGKYLPPVLKKAYEEWKTFTPLVMVSFGVDKVIVSEAHSTEYLGNIQIGRTEVVGYNVMNRSMYDDTLAPEGKTALQLYFLSPWDIWKELTDAEYAQEKEAIKKRCTELLEEHYPRISAHIEAVDLATPRTTTRYTGVWKGSYEGFSPELGVLGSSLPMELEGLKNFSMVGQWVMPGGGLPPSAQSGRWAIQMLAKEDNKRFKHYVPA